MSQIYIKEPPTNGKVLLKTTLGDMDIELWSKEAPLACRNFIQLCMEGYYNGTFFHRIVRDFIAQGGDPTGTGEGGESIYGHPFKDEFHSRLKFNRRGLVGMANGGRDDNSSQFFITLNRADELSNKHTLFGKITGDTLYNMIRLNDIPTDKEDRPIDPRPKILKTKVLLNPFDDIEPRIDKRQLEKKIEKPKSQSKATKNFGLLSFGEEAEEDEEETSIASKDLKIRSSHDVLMDDPKLSAEPVLDSPICLSVDKEKKREKKKRKREENEDNQESPQNSQENLEGDEDGENFDLQMRRMVKKKLGHYDLSWEDEIDMEEDKVAVRTEELKMESKQLIREMKEAERQRKMEARKKEKEAQESEDIPETIKAMRKEHQEYKKKKTTLKGRNREEETLELLSRFKTRLRADRMESPIENNGGKESAKPGGVGGGVEEEEVEERVAAEGKLNWLNHQLMFTSEEDKLVLAKDANVQNENTYDIFDPRNPLNKRRRGEGEQQQRQTGSRQRSGRTKD